MTVNNLLVNSALVGVLVAASAGWVPAGAASGMKTFTNRVPHYSLKYAATWTAKPNSQGQDVFITAPDHNAVITSLAVRGTATEAEIKKQQAKVLKGLGKPQGPLNYQVKSVTGVPFQISELVTKNKNGMIIDVILLDTVQGHYLYDFEGFTVLNKPSTKQEIAAVVASFNSIRLSS